MLTLWWFGRSLLKVVSVFVFLGAVFFAREIVHEIFNPHRQVADVMPYFGSLDGEPWTILRAASEIQDPIERRPPTALSKVRLNNGF